MAYSVNRSTISPEAANSIHSMLCLQPETPNSKYNRGKIPEPVLFYNVHDNIVDLPYLFAASLFQITPNIDIPYPTTQLTFTGTLRENQVTVEQESWDQLEKYGTSTLGLYPGFGKTILGAKLASRAKLMTVVLVHREILTTQWKKTFEDFTNASVWIVGEKTPPPICDVIICMDTRWDKIPKQMRDSIGFLIIDEAHAFCTPTHVGCLLAFHPKYIVIESATLEREDGMDSMIYAIAGEHGVFREMELNEGTLSLLSRLSAKKARSLSEQRKE
jgi:superfamily II DNA or RNA helicase